MGLSHFEGFWFVRIPQENFIAFFVKARSVVHIVDYEAIGDFIASELSGDVDGDAVRTDKKSVVFNGIWQASRVGCFSLGF